MFIYQQYFLFQNSGSTLIGWKLREIKPPMDRQSYISTICLAQRIKLILSFFEYEEEHFSLHTVELCLRPAGTNKLQCLQEAVLHGNMICRYYLKSGYYSRAGPKRDFTVSTIWPLQLIPPSCTSTRSVTLQGNTFRVTLHGYPFLEKCKQMPAQKVQEKHAQVVQHCSVTLKGVP